MNWALNGLLDTLAGLMKDDAQVRKPASMTQFVRRFPRRSIESREMAVERAPRPPIVATCPLPGFQYSARVPEAVSATQNRDQACPCADRRRREGGEAAEDAEAWCFHRDLCGLL